MWFWLRLRDPGWLWPYGPVAVRSADAAEALGVLVPFQWSSPSERRRLFRLRGGVLSWRQPGRRR